MSFPECFHRGRELVPGRFHCRHPGLVVQPAGVTESLCRMCEKAGKWCNKEPLPMHYRGREQSDCERFPCIHRGKPIELKECVPCGGTDFRTGDVKMLLVLECLNTDLFPNKDGKCTVTAGGIRDEKGKLPVCVACDHRTANRNLIAGQPESA